MPWVLSTLAVVLAATRCPRLTSSPWMRCYPQVGLSTASPTIRVASTSAIGGPPMRRWVGPAPANQAAMPAKQRLGPHAERRPALRSQKPSSARQARPHRPARGEGAAAGGAGSQAGGAAPGSRSPWTRCAGAPTPRATARGRRRGTPTTILRNRDHLAGARRRRTAVGSIQGANSLVHDFNRVFGPYGQRSTAQTSSAPALWSDRKASVRVCRTT